MPLRAQIVVPPLPPQREFSITAGNAFFDQSPALGTVCTFNFGDPSGAYNVLTGFNAAHIYQTPGNYTLTLSRDGQADITKTIHVLPDHRALMPVDRRDNLMDIARALQDNTVVLLPAGGEWDVAGPVEIKARNVEFRAYGKGPPPCIRRLANKSSSTLVCTGLDITFRGIEFDSDRVMAVVGNDKVNIRAIRPETAHVSIVGCTFRNVDDCVFCTPMTRGVLVQGCTFTDEVRSEDVWLVGSNIVILGNKMLTSQREHNIRSSERVTDVLVDYNDITATHRKETLTFRVGECLFAAHNLFRTGWVRIGPGPHGDRTPMSPEELRRSYVRYAVIEDNEFTAGSYQVVNEGSSDVLVRYNRFDVDPENVPVRVQGPSVDRLTIEDNYRLLTAGHSAKPFMRTYDINPGLIVEQNDRTLTAAEADALRGK